mmetsp:Transcript_13783/g.34993  ORF Transcript_13783/g.34993 Transcript_13783/m.34993 type:complete len:245 (+) Transcript_13783:239-973(+)
MLSEETFDNCTSSRISLAEIASSSRERSVAIRSPARYKFASMTTWPTSAMRLPTKSRRPAEASVPTALQSSLAWLMSLGSGWPFCKGWSNLSIWLAKFSICWTRSTPPSHAPPTIVIKIDRRKVACESTKATKNMSQSDHTTTVSTHLCKQKPKHHFAHGQRLDCWNKNSLITPADSKHTTKPTTFSMCMMLQGSAATAKMSSTPSSSAKYLLSPCDAASEEPARPRPTVVTTNAAMAPTGVVR